MTNTTQVGDQLRLDLLREALPYIQRFQGQTFVVKLSGKVTEHAANLTSLAEELALLHQVGIHLCVVHGGGKQLSIDASLYSGNWAAGKSGFKALQYMAVGIPYVATPVGASAEIGIEGTTHFCARTNEEWHDALSVLLRDTETRKRMGAAGRAHVIENYGLPAQADKLAAALREALSN